MWKYWGLEPYYLMWSFFCRAMLIIFTNIQGIEKWDRQASEHKSTQSRLLFWFWSVYSTSLNFFCICLKNVPIQKYTNIQKKYFCWKLINTTIFELCFLNWRFSFRKNLNIVLIENCHVIFQRKGTSLYCWENCKKYCLLLVTK